MKGYKQTEVGVIPQDWEVEKIKNVSSITTGAKNTQDKIDDGHYPFFVRSQTVEHINSYSSEGEAVLTAGDGVGTGKVFHYINGKFDFHQRVYKISNFNKKLDGYFFYLYFSNNFLNRIMSMTAKSSVDSVRMEMIADMQIPLPTKAEQTTIAAALSDADALITSLEKLITKKHNIKQGAMQELLTGKKRLPGFSGKWEVKKLGEIADIFKGSGLSKSKLNPSGIHKCVLYGELFTTYSQVIKNVISRTNADEGVLSKKGDILMPGSTTTIGIDLAIASALLEDGVLLGGDINIIRKKVDSYNSEFIAHYLTQVKKHEIAELSQGITIIHLYGRDLNALSITIPAKREEQTAIAIILSEMDAEIEQLEQKLSKYRMLKQGMIQELLTGRVRLLNIEVSEKPKATVTAMHEKYDLQKKKHNWEFNEAVVISVLTKAFGVPGYPLGRKRYTKFSYLLHRYAERNAVGYLKKAAGPYNPRTKYGGPEKIAQTRGYIKNHSSGKYSGFIAHDNIAEAVAYFNKWYGQETLRWLEQFRYKDNDQLELLTTVDIAVQDLLQNNQKVSATSVKALIQSHDEWRAKLDRIIFSDENIGKAISESRDLLKT